MSRRIVVSVIAALLLIFVLNLFLTPVASLKQSETSFGVGPYGYKASYDLLTELGFKVARSHLAPRDLTHSRTMWYLAPDFLEPFKNQGEAEASEVVKWIRAGGTAVVFGEIDSDWSRLGIDSGTSVGAKTSMIGGSAAHEQYLIDIEGLLSFKSAPAGASTILMSGKNPFALVMKLGSGRLVVASDGRFILNSNLGDGDASILLVDLASAFGPPTFDEWSHGMGTDVSLVGTLVASRAMLPIVIGILAVLLWMLEQRTWPRRMLDDDADSPAPSVASFIDSLGIIYARAGDAPAVFQAYRGGFLRSLRSKLFPRAEISEETLLKRLSADRSMSLETRRWLIDGEIPSTQAELVIAVRAIESYRGSET
jgi:hypothetical protein